MDLSKYPVKLELRIDWSELDYFGHVNNVQFFKYIQAARINYLELTGTMEVHKLTKKGPILASCKIDFKQPLYYPGLITIHSRISFIKNSSFGFEHVIVNQKNELVAESHDVIVMMDFNTHLKMKIPEDLIQKIEEIEGKSFGPSI
ncbi:MAG TPA: acyl-CoA thioesterase [Lentimicrobium sp.]|nr:acyl-CoA thioesterase [Lentimicrobium sp.]